MPVYSFRMEELKKRSHKNPTCFLEMVAIKLKELQYYYYHLVSSLTATSESRFQIQNCGPSSVVTIFHIILS